MNDILAIVSIIAFIITPVIALYPQKSREVITSSVKKLKTIIKQL